MSFRCYYLCNSTICSNFATSNHIYSNNENKIDVRRAITERGYSITSFAEKSGMKTQNIIQNIINGNPTIKKLEELCEKLECDITDLFYSVDSEHNESIVDRNTSKCQEKQDLQDRQETMFCPRCGTKFVIVNTPKGNEQ